MIRRMAVAFRRPEPISNDEFLDLVFDAEARNPDFSLNSVAYAWRVARSDRYQAELDLGAYRDSRRAGAASTRQLRKFSGRLQLR